MNEVEPYISIPSWSPSKDWHYTTFETREEFREWLKPLFKEPGLYKFDEVSLKFNEYARIFQAKEKILGKGKGIYCEFQDGTKPFIQFWDTEKEKCRKGVIFCNDKGDIWYLPRFYYHWLNFLQIYVKQKKQMDFPSVRDVQYHASLYELLAELYDVNSAWLKARQKASSYIHIAKLFNKYIFEDSFVAKIGASDKKFIEGNNGCWRYLNQYKNFSNSKTAWIRHNDPDKTYSWQQRTKSYKKSKDGKVDLYVGTHAIISGITFEKDPVSGVGGAVDEFFYEEGGVAPTADETYGYIKSAIKEGAVKTGIFTISGSVGKLSQCEPLKEMVLNPRGNEIFAVTTNLLDETGREGESALFIPEFWGMEPYIDHYGNSMVKEAKSYLDAYYKECKNGNPEKNMKPMNPGDYQLLLSQGPRNIAEAFAARSESLFPLKYTAAQVQRIEDKEYSLRYVDLERAEDGSVKEVHTDRRPIEYNVSVSAMRSLPDKRGCCVIHEKPIPDAPWMTYLAAIDPVEKGNTESSESMACVYIYKMPIEVIKTVDGDRTIQLEGGKLVFEWVGRYDDVDDTNEMLSMAVEYYNAWTMCEINKSTWVQHMRYRKRQRYLAKKTDMVFDKDIDIRQSSTHEYGVFMTDKLWKDLMEYMINFLSEKPLPVNRDIGVEKKNKIIYGVERIPFIGLLKEMQAYNPDKGNYDRLKAFGVLIGFVKSQEAKRGGIQQRIERTDADIQRSKDIYEQLKHRNPFHNVGMGRSYQQKVVKNPFRNIH